MLKVPDTLQEWNLGCSEQQTLTDWTLQVIRWLRMSSISFSPRVWLIWLHPQPWVGSLLLQFFAMGKLPANQQKMTFFVDYQRFTMVDVKFSRSSSRKSKNRPCRIGRPKKRLDATWEAGTGQPQSCLSEIEPLRIPHSKPREYITES